MITKNNKGPKVLLIITSSTKSITGDLGMAYFHLLQLSRHRQSNYFKNQGLEMFSAIKLVQDIHCSDLTSDRKNEVRIGHHGPINM